MKLIDADALADNIAVLFERNQALIDEWLMYQVEDTIDDAPTIDAEPVRHGKWIELNTESGIFMTYDEVKCSECGFDEYFFNKGWARFKYCPNCGAKMEEVNDGNDNNAT